MKTLKFKEYKDLNERQFYTKDDWDPFPYKNKQITDVSDYLKPYFKHIIEIVKIGNSEKYIINDPDLNIKWTLFWNPYFVEERLSRFLFQFKRIQCSSLQIRDEYFNSFLNFPEELIVNELDLAGIKIKNFQNFSSKFNIKKMQLNNLPEITSFNKIPMPTDALQIHNASKILTYAGIKISKKMGLYLQHIGTWSDPSILLSDKVIGMDLCDLRDVKIKTMDVTDKNAWTKLLGVLVNLEIEEIQFHYSFLEEVFDTSGLDILEYALEILEIPPEKIKKDPAIQKIRNSKKKTEDDIGFSF